MACSLFDWQMGDHTHLLAFVAQSKGAIGVRHFLQEHRQQVPEMLQELSASVLLVDNEQTTHAGGYRDKDSKDTAMDDDGIYMEHLSLRAQREIWSALASGASPSKDAAVTLARAFLRVTARRRRRETDGVCVSLATIVQSRAFDHEESEGVEGATTAFRRRMRRVTWSRVEFPLAFDEDHKSCDHSPQTLVASGAMTQMSSRRKKRHREEHLNDLWKTEQESRDAASIAPSIATKPQERPLLSKEMENRALDLSKLLVQLARSNAIALVSDVATRTFDLLAQVVNDVHTTYAANEQSFQYLCRLLRMDATSDEALAQITTALVDSNWSSRYAAIFLETSVLPKIRAADSVIPRVLLQTTLRFGSAYAGALVDSLLLPLLVGDNDARVGPAQAEAITRILRSPDTIPMDRLDALILAAVTPKEGADSTFHVFANDSALLVFQNMLNTKPVLSPLTIERFIGACEALLERPDAEHQRSSLKFATVLFTLLSKYPQQCASHVDTLEAIVTQLTSIMAKTTLRLLQKLKDSK